MRTLTTTDDYFDRLEEMGDTPTSGILGVNVVTAALVAWIVVAMLVGLIWTVVEFFQ